MIKSQTDEGLEEVTAPVVTSPENDNQSPQIEESPDDVNTVRMLDNEEDVRMLDNEEDEESSKDTLEPPPRRPVPKSSTMRMLDNALLELEKQMQDISKKDKPVEGGS